MTARTRRDIKGISLAGQIVSKILSELRPQVQPGITTSQIDAICGKLLKEHKAVAAPKYEYGFPGNLCISINDEVVHGVPSSRIIQTGDIVKLDLVAGKNGYLADSTISVCVGRHSQETSSLNDCAEQAFWKAIQIARAGVGIHELGKIIEDEVHRCGFKVLRELCGHGVGRSCHESPTIPNYDPKSNIGVLTEGLIIAVEPIITSGIDKIYTDPDGWTIKTEDMKPTAHFEHTIMITQNKPVILTAA